MKKSQKMAMVGIVRQLDTLETTIKEHPGVELNKEDFLKLLDTFRIFVQQQAED